MSSGFQRDKERYVHGMKVMEIKPSDIGTINILVPPLPLQQAFAEKVKAIEQQKELINQSIKDVQTLFDAKMDYYFGD
jgi:type I restriction enzyme S subunit